MKYRKDYTFKDNQTPLIAGICTSKHDTDPRMVCLSGSKGKQPMGELFKHMLVTALPLAV